MSLAVRLRPLVLAACGAVLSGAIAAPPAASPSALPPMVQRALDRAGIPPENVAVWVQAIGAPAPDLAHNATAAMNPASVIKLVTTYAALELLGPTYTWKTEFWTDAPVVEGVLQGDLVLRGGGDPRLTVERFWLMLRALRDRGIRTIGGDLVLDRTWFDPGPHDPALFDGQALQPYNVGPDALLLNFKAFRLSFVPDPSRGAVTVVSEPPSTALQIENALRLSDRPCTDWRAGLGAEFRDHAPVALVAFRGIYPAACGEREWYVALLPHPHYVHGVFRRMWAELGGELRGGLREGTVPPGARLLYRHESAPLAEIVRDINKYSNNVMARQLFLTLSAELSGAPGRRDRSAALVQAWAERKGLGLGGLVLENGSGLSRLERASAAGIGRLLAAAYRSAVMPEFVSSLPLVAYDGTMRRRLRFEQVAGRAHVKTGSLDGSRAVAGYLLDRHGRRHVVVFVINHPNAANGQEAQDALLRWTYQGAHCRHCGGPVPH